MTVSKEVARALDMLDAAAAGLPGLLDLDPEERRRLFDPLALKFARQPVAGVARSQAAYGVLHMPQNVSVGPEIVHVHGGGWVFLSPETHSRFCDHLAVLSRRPVHAVRYPLAPEDPFPAPLLSVQKSLRALAAHGPVVVSGDSAGANLALSAALSLGSDVVCGAGLIYGVFDDDPDTASHRAFGTGAHPLTTEEMAMFWTSYAPDDRPWQARPLHGPLQAAPPCVILTAQTDCLRSDSEVLVDRLNALDRPVVHRDMTGLYHGAILHDTLLPSLMPHLKWYADQLCGLHKT